MASKLISLIKLGRPSHWSKNLFLFVPAFFAQVFLDPELLIKLGFGFLSFGLISSGIYALNDYRDYEYDKIHPEKKNRPLAAGLVSKREALGFSIISSFLGIALAALLNPQFTMVCLIYLFLNLSYSFYLKDVSLMDVLIIAIGFELRVLGGGFIAEVPISPWLTLMVFLLALFIAFAKRRSDLVLIKDPGLQRKSVGSYSLRFLDTTLSILASILVVCYVMYSQSQGWSDPKGKYHIITSVFVLFGILRYLQISLVFENSSQPVKLLFKDRILQFCLLGWLALNFWILY